MLLQEKNIISPEEYLALERESSEKSEYFDGEMFAMAGASREHNQISSNIVRILGNDLLEKPCSVFSSDMKVKVGEIGKYTYPDVVVVCKDEQYEDENRDVLLNPLVIIEILSDSTEAYDRGDKFLHYQLIDSFSEYILISQYCCKVEKFSRQGDDTWIYSKYINIKESLSIEFLKSELLLSEIYRKVIFS
jgi:Uma2 family endonuclease